MSKLRDVLSCEQIGYHATWPPARGSEDMRSKSYRLDLACGHFAMCVAATAPVKFDCMVCGQTAVQLLLPLWMPVLGERKL